MKSSPASAYLAVALDRRRLRRDVIVDGAGGADHLHGHPQRSERGSRRTRRRHWISRRSCTHDVAHTMSVDASFTGLHRERHGRSHPCRDVCGGTGTAGVATTTPTFPGFPSGVTSGSYSNTFDLTLASSWNATFITDNGGTRPDCRGGPRSGDGGWQGLLQHPLVRSRLAARFAAFFSRSPSLGRPSSCSASASPAWSHDVGADGNTSARRWVGQAGTGAGHATERPLEPSR